MRTKSYRHGKSMGKTYLKSVGEGWETGFIFEGKAVFVGNFVHVKEATEWFSMLNREIRTFSKKYTVGNRFPATWFKHFMKNHLYMSYYSYLDRVFTKHNKNFHQAVVRDIRKYQQLKRNWSSRERMPFIKAA